MKITECDVKGIIGAIVFLPIYQVVTHYFGEQGVYTLMAVLLGIIIAGLCEKNRHF